VQDLRARRDPPLDPDGTADAGALITMGTIGSNLDKTVSKLENQLALWGAQLEELVAQGKVAGQHAKIDSAKRLDEIKLKLEGARSKLAEAKAAGDDKWDAFKHAVETHWKELEGAFKQLAP
jgi:hypothetical protein